MQFAEPTPWLAWNKCHRLGTPDPGNSQSPVPGSMVWGLYDYANPSRGVWVQYTGGDSCGVNLALLRRRV